MTSEQLRVFKILLKQREHKLLSTMNDRELLRCISFNEGLKIVLNDLEDFVTGKLDPKYISRVLELEGK